MGQLKDLLRGDEPEEDLEDTYQRLFPKMGRDFVYLDDLIRILQPLVQAIDPTGDLGIDLYSKIEAIAKAEEYRDSNLDYEDLI